MLKRILASVLWFVAIAYTWNLIAAMTGYSQAPGLVLGVVAAVLFGGDPLHRIWFARTVAQTPAP